MQRVLVGCLVLTCSLWLLEARAASVSVKAKVAFATAKRQAKLKNWLSAFKELQATLEEAPGWPAALKLRAAVNEKLAGPHSRLRSLATRRPGQDYAAMAKRLRGAAADYTAYVTAKPDARGTDALLERVGELNVRAELAEKLAANAPGQEAATADPGEATPRAADASTQPPDDFLEEANAKIKPFVLTLPRGARFAAELSRDGDCNLAESHRRLLPDGGQRVIGRNLIALGDADPKTLRHYVSDGIDNVAVCVLGDRPRARSQSFDPEEALEFPKDCFSVRVPSLAVAKSLLAALSQAMRVCAGRPRTAFTPVAAAAAAAGAAPTPAATPAPAAAAPASLDDTLEWVAATANGVAWGSDNVKLTQEVSREGACSLVITQRIQPDGEEAKLDRYIVPLGELDASKASDGSTAYPGTTRILFWGVALEVSGGRLLIESKRLDEQGERGPKGRAGTHLVASWYLAFREEALAKRGAKELRHAISLCAPRR